MSDKETKEPLDTSLIETLSNSDLHDVGIESAEVLVDSFLTDGAPLARNYSPNCFETQRARHWNRHCCVVS